MKHHHTWHVVACLALSLPTQEHFVERLTQWICSDCGQHVAITGEIRIGTALYWPEWWDELERRQRRGGRR